MKVSANGVFVYIDYALAAVSNLRKEILIYSCFERSEIALRGFMANVGMKDATIYEDNGDGTSNPVMFSKIETINHYTRLMNGREPISHGVCVSKKINTQYIITTEKDLEQDLYNWLMSTFTLPLLREWIPYILEAGAEYIVKNEIRIYGRVPPELEDALVFENCLTEVILRELVSEGLKEKQIYISKQEQRPLQFENMDDYFAKYGHSLVENLERKLKPLVPLKDKVDEIAFLHKRFYPQQAAIVNGLMECMRHRKSAIINEDMGCGKTLQGMGVIEGFFNAWFLRQNKDKTIKDVYLDKGNVKYRNIIMCPSHLVEKWAESIRDDIPYATTTIVRNLRELIHLRKRGKERTGKEFYILSKDTGKLSYSYVPIPTQVKIRPVRQMVCKECNTVRQDYSIKECVCKSKQWVVEDIGMKKEGMICPDCGELLFPADIKTLKFMEDGGTEPLLPKDFSVQTGANKNCRYCGSALWQPCCEPLESKYFFRRKAKRNPPKWIKMTHWANKAEKNKRTVWVFGKHASSYIEDNELIESEISYPRIYGPRKFAPARYISKFLRGYFDFAIFDEAHECESSQLLDTNNTEMC